MKESFGPYILRCPECRKLVDTVPAEGVPDQSLRGCPTCGAVFDQETETELRAWVHERNELLIENKELRGLLKNVVQWCAQDDKGKD